MKILVDNAEHISDIVARLDFNNLDVIKKDENPCYQHGLNLNRQKELNNEK